MANIHKVLIMKVPVGGRFFTTKHPDGRLSSGIKVEEILQRTLPKREFKRYKHEIEELVAPKQCVVYDKGLLDEPELDDMLAESIGYIHRFSKLDVCRPNIILLMRDSKKKPATEANINGYHHIINMFFSRRFSTELRFKAYEIFNKALEVDKRNKRKKTNTFLAVLHLFWWNLSDMNVYRKLIDKLWMDPELFPGQNFDWGHYVIASKGKEGNFKSTPYYNDSRFIEIVHHESEAAHLQNIVNEHGEHPPRFRKTG